MPVLRGKDFYYVKNTKNRFKYKVGNKKSREMAKRKALKQLIAIKISQTRRRK